MQSANGLTETPAGRLGLAARAIGILTSPRATFERVVVDPRWLGILALSVCMSGVLSAGLLSTDFAQRAILDQQARSMEAFGVTMTDEIYEQMERRAQFGAYTTLGSVLIFVPIGLAILAGVLYGAGYGFLGARVSFQQVFAVVAHAGVVYALQALFVTPLNYARESILPPATLAAFVPMLDEASFVFRLLSTIDVFHVWWVMILSIGLAVLWQRRTAPITATLFVIYGVFVLAMATLRTMLGF